MSQGYQKNKGGKGERLPGEFGAAVPPSGAETVPLGLCICIRDRVRVSEKWSMSDLLRPTPEVGRG